MVRYDVNSTGGSPRPRHQRSAPFGRVELDYGICPAPPRRVGPGGVPNGHQQRYRSHVQRTCRPYPLLDPAQRIRLVRHEAADLGRSKKSAVSDPGWINQPRILLVEDDATCRQIGGKFLYSFSCVIDSAVSLGRCFFSFSESLLICLSAQLDGLEAVSKIQQGLKFDMILMDIIMPNLDGVSACHLIRQFDRTPIVAMTSNIRSDDIQMYFQHGEQFCLV